MTSLSTSASAVLHTVITNSMPTGDPLVGMFYTSNAISEVPPAVQKGTLGQNVQTSGFMQSVTTTNIPESSQQYTTTGYTFPAGQTIWIGDPPYNDGGLYPPINPMPQNPWPGNITFPPIPTKPDLDQLEEGEHDIPGGKIIIKKIKITEKQIEEAMEEVLGPEASPEEKSKIRKEIEDYAASEEREV